MYNIPHNINWKNVRKNIFIDLLSILLLILTIILWVLIEDIRWYGVYSKDLSGLQLNQYNQWHLSKYIELFLSMTLIGYTLYKRNILTILKRIFLLMPIIVLWVYWVIFQ